VLAAAASCSDNGANVTSGEATAGQGGEPSAVGGHAGTSAKAGSSSGGKLGLGGAAAEGGASPGNAGQPSDAGHPGDAGQPNIGTGGELSVGGASGGESVGGANNPLGGDTSGGMNASAGAGGAPEPNCDDLDDQTVDFYNVVYGCGHETDKVPGGGDGWIFYDMGFYFDELTGTAWTPVDTVGSVATATKFCDDLVIGKLSDFKIPTIDQVRASFAAGCAPTAPGGTCPIHDPDHLSTMELYGNICSSCQGGLGKDYWPDNAPFHTWIRTSSLCSDCAEASGWLYGPGNGNFAAIPIGDALGVSCVLPGLPDAMP
jgi:hypothetical protein